MCGRFVQDSLFPLLQREFNLKSAEVDLSPSYNIAPTQEVAVVVNEDGNRLVMCRWGLIPPGARDIAIGNRMINARAETVAEKPSFRAAFRKHRCLVVATGFYEWRKVDSRKIPVYIHMKDNSPFGFAGLYSDWRAPDGGSVRTCTIITTEPNELLAPIHNRMPAIIPREARELWLNPGVQGPDRLLPLLGPFDPEGMEAWDVSTRVNSPGNDGEALIMPLA